MIRLVGALFIVAGSASAGFYMAGNVRKTQRIYRDALRATAYMKSEIECYLTPLHDIYGQLARILPKPLASLFFALHEQARRSLGLLPAVHFSRARQQQKNRLPHELGQILAEMFDLLGRQDAVAQIRAITLAEERLNEALGRVSSEKKERCHAYETIGICAGIALVIILV